MIPMRTKSYYVKRGFTVAFICLTSLLGACVALACADIGNRMSLHGDMLGQYVSLASIGIGLCSFTLLCVTIAWDTAH